MRSQGSLEIFETTDGKEIVVVHKELEGFFGKTQLVVARCCKEDFFNTFKGIHSLSTVLYFDPRPYEVYVEDEKRTKKRREAALAEQ